MITKENIITTIIEGAILLMSGTTTIMGIGVVSGVLASFNPLYIPLGVIGQLIAIAADYVAKTNAGTQIKSKPAKFWLSAVFLGAMMSYIATNALSNKIGVPEGIVAVVLGIFAQYLPKLITLGWEIIETILKKKFGNE